MGKNGNWERRETGARKQWVLVETGCRGLQGVARLPSVHGVSDCVHFKDENAAVHGCFRRTAERSEIA